MTTALDRQRGMVIIEQVATLARRSVVNTWRQPAAWTPSIIFPLMMAAIYSAQFERVTELPQFPQVDSFLQFILPATILQGISFNAGEAGSALATDIETGFFDRLMASPVGRQSVLVGRLAGAAAFSALLAAVLMGIFVLFGAKPEGGFASALAIVGIAAALSLSIGGISVAVALWTGSPEATQAVFPLTFIAIFVSSAFFPTEMMSGWYKTAAEANPFTLIIDPTRRLAIDGFSFTDVGQALFWIAVIGVFTLGVAYRAYLARLRRS